MNYDLKNLPERTTKPRQYGFTMAMDKGLSVREAEDFVSMCADHVDIVKLGWATSFVTPTLKEKLKVYKLKTKEGQIDRVLLSFLLLLKSFLVGG